MVVKKKALEEFESFKCSMWHAMCVIPTRETDLVKSHNKLVWDQSCY